MAIFHLHFVLILHQTLGLEARTEMRKGEIRIEDKMERKTLFVGASKKCFMGASKKLM